MMTEKRFTLNYIDEQHISANIYDNGTFIASISVGEKLVVELLNCLAKENGELKKENNNLKKALWEAEENYLYEAYYNNSARREDKLENLKEDFKRGYWND